MSRGLGVLALVAVVLVGGAVAVLGFRVSPQPAASAPPTVKALNADARRTLREEPQELARDSVTRAAEQMTLRVRNISCAGVATGSGFAVDAHTIITNRHVLQGAAVLELNTWDGGSLDADVNEASTGRLVDIGVTRVTADLPAVAELGKDPEAGDRVTAVGYPLGGPLTLSAGAWSATSTAARCRARSPSTRRCSPASTCRRRRPRRAASGRRGSGYAPGGERQRAAERIADGGHAVTLAGVAAELGDRRQVRGHPRHADVDEPAGRGLVDVGVQRDAVPRVELQDRRALQDVPVGDDRVRVDGEGRAGGHAGAGDVAHAQGHPLGRAGHAVARELLRFGPQRATCVRFERLHLRRGTRGGLRYDAEAEHGDGAADEHQHDQRADPEPAVHPNCAWKAAKSFWAFSHVVLTAAALASTHAKSSAA